MRFASATILALPLLAAAAQQQSPLDQVKEKAQYYFDKLSSFLPSPNLQHPVDAAAAKLGGKNVKVLTIDNWKSTLQPSSRTYSESPEEWWVLITGGNKTCYRQCSKIETAFNETAAVFAATKSAPHLAYVNCDYQPILCNSWAAGPPTMWIFEVGAPGTPVDIRILNLNTTTTDAKMLIELHTKRSWLNKPKYDGYFHPFDGPIAKYGLAQPLAYVIWVFSVIPSWVFMIAISFLSRTMMSVMWKEPAQRAPRRG